MKTLIVLLTLFTAMSVWAEPDCDGKCQDTIRFHTSVSLQFKIVESEMHEGIPLATEKTKESLNALLLFHTGELRSFAKAIETTNFQYKPSNKINTVTSSGRVIGRILSVNIFKHGEPWSTRFIYAEYTHIGDLFVLYFAHYPLTGN